MRQEVITCLQYCIHSWLSQCQKDTDKLQGSSKTIEIIKRPENKLQRKTRTATFFYFSQEILKGKTFL